MPTVILANEHPACFFSMEGQASILVNWYSSAVRRGGGTNGHISRGFIKAFMVYFLPSILLGRGKVTIKQVRRALALGVFASGVRAVDSVLRALDSEEKASGHSAQSREINFVKQYSLGVAAALSSFLAFTIDGDVTNSLLVLMWAFARAVRTMIPDVNIPFLPVITMCLSASQILTSYVWSPKDLDPGYYRFLLLHGGKSEKDVLDVLKTSVLNPCSIIHAGQGCGEHFVSFWGTEYLKAARIYLPVFTLSLIFSQKWNLVHWLTNILRSSAFLATYCTLAWFSCGCIWSQYINPGAPLTRWQYQATLWVSGLATLIERPSRQVELATYCFTYAADSVLRHIENRGYPVRFPTLNLFLLSACIGVLVHNHDQQPKEIVRFLFKLSHA